MAATTPAAAGRRRGSLARRLTLTSLAILAVLALFAAAAELAVRSINRDLGDALAQYAHLRLYYDVGVEVTRARVLAQQGDVSRDAALLRVQAALLRLREVAIRTNNSAQEADAQRQLADRLEAAQQLLLTPPAPGSAPGSGSESDRPIVQSPDHQISGTSGGVVAKLDGALNVIAGLTQQTTAAIDRIEAKRRAESSIAAVVLIVAALLAAAAAAGLGVLQHRRIMRPLRELERGVEQVRSGDLAHRLTPAGDRELADLAGRFNDMTAELEALYRDLDQKVRTQSRQLARSERLASVGHLAAGVAHEINNPLGIIVAEVELAQRRLTQHMHDSGAAQAAADASELAMLDEILEQAMRCKRMTQRLLSLASVEAGVRRRVSARQLAVDAAELARSLPQARDKRVILTRPEAAVELSTDSALVGQVLLNLLTNALEATPAGTGRVQFSVRAEPGRVCFEVKDNGRGLDEAELTKVFEPFYTSKRGAAAGGSGLGLSISHAIVESLGGMLTAASQGPGCGSTFTLLLPADRTDAPTPNA